MRVKLGLRNTEYEETYALNPLFPLVDGLECEVSEETALRWAEIEAAFDDMQRDMAAVYAIAHAQKYSL